MTRKNYFFIIIQEDVQAIDFEKSNFVKTYPIKPEIGRRFLKAEIENAKKIVLNEKFFGTKSIFFIDQYFFHTLLYCNEEFKNSVEAQKFKTIEFFPIERIIEYLDYKYNLKLSNTEFIIE